MQLQSKFHVSAAQYDSLANKTARFEMRNLVLSFCFLTECFVDSQETFPETIPQQETTSFYTTESPKKTTLGDQITTENYTDLSTVYAENNETMETTSSLEQFSTIENTQTLTSISSDGPGDLNFTVVYPNEDDTNCFENFISSWQGIGTGSPEVI